MYESIIVIAHDGEDWSLGFGDVADDVSGRVHRLANRVVFLTWNSDHIEEESSGKNVDVFAACGLAYVQERVDKSTFGFLMENILEDGETKLSW